MLHLVCFSTISSAFDYTVTGHEAGDRLKPLNSILQIWTTFRIGGHSICSYAPQTLSNLISFLGYLLKCLIEVWLFRRDELDCVSSRQLWKQQQKLFAFGSTWFKTRTSRILPGKQVWFVFPFTYFWCFSKDVWISKVLFCMVFCWCFFVPRYSSEMLNDVSASAAH